MKRANIIVGVMSSVRLTLLVFYGFFSPLMEGQAVPVQEVTTTSANNDNNQEISPFLVLGVGHKLYSLPYTWPEAPDQSDAMVLYSGTNFFHYITGISYHYRRRLIFWCTTGGIVSTATFSDRTELTNIKHERVINGNPWDQLVVADLAVDWINDKLYWTVQDEGKIEELDLETGVRKTIIQSEGEAAFNGLVVYPYPNYGWIFWTNNQEGSIERVAVTGEARQLVRGNLGKCVWPLEIDYSQQTVYWVNTCENTVRSLQIGDGNSELQSADRVTIDSSFMGTTSMTLFESVLYWNEAGTVKGTNKSTNLGDIVQIYQASESLSIITVAVELVHAGKQPQEEEFLEIIHENINMEMLNETCPPCVNGHCVPPGLCACNKGWSGENCTTDMDECALEEDDCDYECHNTLGGFYCSCNSSSYLDSDGRTCILGSPTTTYVIDPTVSTGIGPEETPPGDYESTATSLTNVGPIHSRTIMGSDTLLPALSSQFVVVLPSSSAATYIAASGTPTSEIYYSTSQPSFLSESTATSISQPSFLPESTSDLSFLPKSTSIKSEPSLFHKSTSITLLASPSSSSSSIYIISGNAVSSMTSRLLVTRTSSQSKLPKPTSSFAEQHKTSTRHVLDYSVSVTVSEQAAIAASSTTFLGLTSSFPTAMLLLPSSTSLMASAVATGSPTPSALSTTSVLSSSTPTYATRSPFTPSSMVSGPRETSTTASKTTPSDADSSTDPLPGATEPSSDGMTLIVIAAASAGACVILIIVVIIMIAAVVHYASKRCGSYTVNPDPAKNSGTPSWVSAVVHTSSASASNHVNGLANGVNGANGHTNGYSYRTKSLRGSSPTCSTNSFT